MRQEVIEVTPEMARRWLSGVGEHTLDKAKVARFAEEMSKGSWVSDSPIVLMRSHDPVDHHEHMVGDDERVIKEGHHRLAAVVKSGFTVRFLVSFLE